MKRNILALCLIIVSCFSMGCGKKDNVQVNDKGKSVNSRSETQGSQPRFQTMDYQSVDELASDLTASFDEDTLDEIERRESNEKKGTFKGFITDRKLKNKLLVPYYRGKMITLRNKEGFSNIYLNPSGLYNRPDISYMGRINNHKFTIITTYLDENEVKAVVGKDVSFYLSKYHPDAPNTDNFETFNFYKNIFEKEIKLKDRIVKALVYEYKDDTEITLTFIYDEILVNIMYDPQKINEDVFNDITFKDKKLK